MSSDVSLTQKSKLIFDNVKYQFLASVAGKLSHLLFIFLFLISWTCQKNIKKCFPSKYIERFSDATFITEIRKVANIRARKTMSILL